MKVDVKPMSINQVWKTCEIILLKAFYPIKGKQWCVKYFNRTEASIRAKSSNLKLKLDKTSLFYKEFQSRAARSKIGKKRPNHSKHMKKLYCDNRILQKRESSECISKRKIEWHQNNPHPKGFQNKKHNKESRLKIATASRNNWADPTSYLNSKKHRQKLSDNGVKSMNIRMKSPSGNIYSRGRRGWVQIADKKIYARSSWEANIAAYYQFLKENGEIIEWEHEPKTFYFENIKRGVRSYLPDFRITEKDSSVNYVEVKGYMDKKSKTKIKRFAKYYKKERLVLIQNKEYTNIKKQSSLYKYWGLLDKKK